MGKQQFNEKESLAIITQMIESTRQNMQLGSGNLFLIYGYSLACVSLLVYLLQLLTHNPVWSFLWITMFGVMFFTKSKTTGTDKGVMTYTDQAVSGIWEITGILFILTFVVISLSAYFLSYDLFNLMLPLSLIYMAIGTSMTGVMIKESLIKYIPVSGFICGMYMLIIYVTTGQSESLWNLYFCIASVVTMIIPGHILNHKSKR